MVSNLDPVSMIFALSSIIILPHQQDMVSNLDPVSMIFALSSIIILPHQQNA